MPKSRLLAFVIKELRELLPPMVFFAVSFNLIVLTTDLILADYRASLGNFMVATMAALVVRKSVLVANVAAVQIWIFVLFLIYTSVEELNARLGDGELMKIFFTRRLSETKSPPPAATSRAPRARPADRDTTII